MNDYQIRIALKHDLFVRYLRDPETLIFSEVGLRHGRARIDLLVVNSLLHGFELKSDRDRLVRLQDQARIYNSVLDRVTLVVAHRHASKAMQIIPEWWGVKVAGISQRGTIHFSDARRPHNNPSPDILAVAKLLWRDEALALLDDLGAANGFRSKPRARIYARLAEVADPDLLHARVRRQFRCRKDWRFDKRRMLSGD